HLATIAARIIPHDEANLGLLTEGGTQFQEYRTPCAADTTRGPDCPLRNLAAPQLVNDIRGAGPYRSGVSAPVRIHDRPLGVFALLAHGPHQYSIDDVEFVQCLADCVAIAVSHQRLSESARQVAVEHERIATIESSMELLRTISDVLDIRTVF